jgi:hypothetical protein
MARKLSSSGHHKSNCSQRNSTPESHDESCADKLTHSQISAYDGKTSGRRRRQPGDREFPATEPYALPDMIHAASARRNTMAKGQQRGNKEAKKPKKEKSPAAPVGTFITLPKVNQPHKH